MPLQHLQSQVYVSLRAPETTFSHVTHSTCNHMSLTALATKYLYVTQSTCNHMLTCHSEHLQPHARMSLRALAATCSHVTPDQIKSVNYFFHAVALACNLY